MSTTTAAYSRSPRYPRRRSSKLQDLGKAMCKMHYLYNRHMARCVLLGGTIIFLFFSSRLIEVQHLSAQQQMSFVPVEGRSERMIVSRELSFQQMIEDIETNVLSPAGNSSTRSHFHSNSISSLSALNRTVFTNSIKQHLGSEVKFVPKASVIITFQRFDTGEEAVRHLVDILSFLPDELVSDVMVVVHGTMKEQDKVFIENTVDLCDKCRIFFLNQTIYQTRNFMMNFAHEDILVFLDGRVRLTSNWLDPMIAKVSSDPKAVVSPRVLLTTPKGDVTSLGAYVNEITWDLYVVRGSDSKANRLCNNPDTYYIQQTAFAKEVLVVRKRFFQNIGGFISIDSGTGTEDAVTSLTILNCGGSILQSVKSTVYLVISSYTHVYKASNLYPDFYSPSFLRQLPASRSYSHIMSNIFLDKLSLQFSICSTRTSKGVNVQRKGGKVMMSGSSSALGKDGSRLKRALTAKQCRIANFRTAVMARQTKMKIPAKNSLMYGYIRSLDGMYAFGAPAPTFTNIGRPGEKNSTGDLNWGDLTLTRNSSLWIGPFSFANDNIIYDEKYCLTSRDQQDGVVKRLTLTYCVKGQLTQRFILQNFMIKPIVAMSLCVLSTATSSTRNITHPISVPLGVSLCSSPGSTGKNRTSGEPYGIREFKFDVEYFPNCIQ